MIFDECHNAQKDHPMLLLMAEFNRYKADQLPRVIGLTGMLTAPSIKPQNVLGDLQRLEATFRATIKTAQGDSFTDVLQHSTCPTETTIEFETNRPSQFHEFLLRTLAKMIKSINEWPLEETNERLSDRRHDKQPKIGKKFEGVCKEFEFQLKNLGAYQIIFSDAKNFGRFFDMDIFFHTGGYGSYLANLAAIVDLELRKREATTSAAKLVSRSLITCKSMKSI